MAESNYLPYTDTLAETMALAYRKEMPSGKVIFHDWLLAQGAELVRHPESKQFTLYFKDSKIITMFILKWVK